jgi:hypothetical protein
VTAAAGAACYLLGYVQSGAPWSLYWLAYGGFLAGWVLASVGWARGLPEPSG